MKKKVISTKNTSNAKGHAGNFTFFSVNYTTSCSFSKTVNLTVFYSKITWNLPLDLL